MEIHAADAKCVVFSLSEKEVIGGEQAEKLVREILKEKLLPGWGQMSIDMFTGIHGSLYLAHPVPEIRISIAPCLLPFLGEYFTE